MADINKNTNGDWDVNLEGSESITLQTDGKYMDGDINISAFSLNNEKVYQCTYGTTTYDEVTEALNNGSIPYFLYNDKLYFYSRTSSDSYVFFDCSGPTCYYANLKNTNVWSNGTDNLQKTGDRVNSITSSSTTSQYPSAKAVYDIIVDKTPYEATKGTSTYADVKAVYEGGREVIVHDGGRTYNLTRVTDTAIVFNQSEYNNLNVLVLGSNNVWTGQWYGVQSTSNKTTSITSSSTDTQYPSAKAVYDYIQSLNGNGVDY